ncbi:MAG: Flp pilus assembly complex ATPase component TadA [Elusimicrobia bacterium]|nr:Flp pilus assembly complex ATPase component TadA [Elusimicrobiota bacterium]
MMFDARQASLGEILVQVGVITADQLKEGLRACGGDHRKLAGALIESGFTTEEKIIKAISMRLEIPFFMSFDGMMEPDAVKALPETVARKCMAVPLFRTAESLTVGMADPLDINAVDEVARSAGLRVLTVMTTLSNLFDSIERAYARKPSAPGKEPSLLSPAGTKGVRALAEEGSVVAIVNSLLQEGISRKASDIHLESGEKMVRTRFRVDGMLQEGKSFGKDLEAALVARVKILARLDITETRLPQDGHLRVDYGGNSVDVRVSTLPSTNGEKVVLRILDSAAALRVLTALDMSPAILAAYRTAISQPNGLILVTGPTSSGKTTTLYAALSELNSKERNIITIEDPVEYRVSGITQVAAQPKIGLSFAAGLRSILRQDPNVILVGEIRDLETAEIAVQAAMTGHLVFTTLHTNDAVTAVHRLINMRVESFLLADTLRGVLAQRLLRRLCVKCRRPHSPASFETAQFDEDLKGGSFFEPAGCPDCFSTGYSGRIAVHEWFGASPQVRELIVRGATSDALRAQAKSEGLGTLREDALAKAKQGITSLIEVLRVTREERA